MAVLVSGWAHVLHAVYKPWGSGSVMYALQHGSLFVTTFVFLMGLLFKVNGVASSSTSYTALSAVMLALCVCFVVAWLAVVLVEMLVRHARAFRLRNAAHGGEPPASSRGRRSSQVDAATAWRTEADAGVALAPAESAAAMTYNPLRTRHQQSMAVRVLAPPPLPPPPPPLPHHLAAVTAP